MIDKPKVASMNQTAGFQATSLQPEPREPNLHEKMNEILRHLSDAHDEAARLDGNLFGASEMESGCPSEPKSPTSVDGIAARCSEFAAMLVGRLARMNREAGSALPPEPSIEKDPDGKGLYFRSA